MKNNKGFIDIEYFVTAGIVIIVLAIIAGGSWWNWKTTYGNQKTLEITVKDKYIKRSGSESDKYLVVDTDGNTYEITDLTWLGKWNSTDLYNQLELNNTYKIETSGVRNGFLSLHPNINKIEKIEE